uniref:Capsid protein n=1 Tax=Paspalum striate mosaic virus TaxID=1072672 RepID=J7FH89_9GEMI|nr:capsid protein [Paspalum striate mosaic virus]
MAASSKRKRGSTSATKRRKKPRYTKWTSARISNRDALQVQTFTWGEDHAFNAGGRAILLTAFTRGSAENQRKSQETITYKVSINLGVSASATVLKYCCKSQPLCWLVYDKCPTGITDLTPSDIFDVPSGLQNWPSTWKVKREASHRFVVKRRWPFTLSCNGSTFQKDYTNLPVCNTDNLVSVTRFAKGLGVRTEWKDTTTAEASDIKGGALYLVVAPANGLVFTARGVIKVYFKSVGNQ